MKNITLKELEKINGGDLSESSTWGSFADASMATLHGIFGRGSYSGILLTENMRYLINQDHSKPITSC